MAKGLSAAKAKKILTDGYIKGKPLTAKQRKYFGAIASGATPLKAINGGWLDKYQTGGSVPGASGMMYSRTSGNVPIEPGKLKKAQVGKTQANENNYEFNLGPVYENLQSFYERNKDLKTTRTSEQSWLGDYDDNTVNLLRKDSSGNIKFNFCEGEQCAARANRVVNAFSNVGSPYFTPSDETKNEFGMGFSTSYPPTEQQIKENPHFINDTNFGSADSWDYMDAAKKTNPSNVLFSYFDEIGKATEKIDYKNRNEYYAKKDDWKKYNIPMGSYIFGGVKDFTVRESTPEKEGAHTARVVGYLESGEPLIADYGDIVPFSQFMESRPITGIVSVPGKEQHTFERFQKLNESANKKSDSNYWSENIPKDAGSDYVEYHRGIVETQNYMQSALNISPEEYERYAKIAMTIPAKESDYGRGKVYNYTDWMGESTGPSQLNMKNVSDKYLKTLKEIENKYGKNTPEYEGAATILYIKELDSYTKNWAKKGETPQTRPYERREWGLKEMSRETLQDQNPTGYFTHASKDSPVSDTFVYDKPIPNSDKTTRETLRLPYKQIWQDEESYTKEVNEMLPQGLSFKFQDGKRVIEKDTKGNTIPNTLEDNIFYSWQSPNTLIYGDAQGDSTYYKGLKNAYQEMYGDAPKQKYGGSTPKSQGGWLDKYEEGGNLPKAQNGIKEAISKYLGDPYGEAREFAENPDELSNIDNMRHAQATRLTQEAIANKTGNIPLISNTLGFLGSNALGVGHELSTLFGNKDKRDMSTKLLESGEDIFNNLFGSVIGTLPISDKTKDDIIRSASYNNMLPDGYVRGEQGKEDGLSENVYFKNEDNEIRRPEYKNGGKVEKAQIGKNVANWFSSGADYVMDTVEDVTDSVVGAADDILTDVNSSINPWNYRRTEKGDSPLNAFLSGNFKQIPTYDATDKDQAFKKARKELGPGKEFLYDGVRYKTDFKGETTHKGTNNFFAKMEAGVEEGKVTNEQFERFKEVWNREGQPNLNVGKDENDYMLTSKSWDGLGFNNSDHVNNFTDNVFIAKPSNNPLTHMKEVLNELTHVKQQNEAGRVDYTLQYLKDLAGSGIKEVKNFIGETELNLDNEKGIKFGSFNPKKIQKNLYNTPGTLENHAHRGDNNLKDSLTNYVIDGQKLRYGGWLDKYKNGDTITTGQESTKFPKFNLSNQNLNLDERANNLRVRDNVPSPQTLRVIPELSKDNYSVTGKQPLQPQTGNDMVSAYKEPDTYDKVTDILASPLTSLGYLSRGQDIPDALPLGMGNRSPHDAILDMFNPFAMAKYAVQSNNTFENAGPLSFNSATGGIDGLGEYVNAGLEGLGAIPIVPAWLKYGKYAKDVNKLPNYARALATSKYLDNVKVNPTKAKNLYNNKILDEQLIAPNIQSKGLIDFPDGGVFSPDQNLFNIGGRMYFNSQGATRTELIDNTKDFIHKLNDSKSTIKRKNKFNTLYNIDEDAPSLYDGQFFKHNFTSQPIDDWIIHNDKGNISASDPARYGSDQNTWWNKSKVFGSTDYKTPFRRVLGRHIYAPQSGLEASIGRPLNTNRMLMGDVIREGKLDPNNITITPTKESDLYSIAGAEQLTMNPVTGVLERGIFTNSPTREITNTIKGIDPLKTKEQFKTDILSLDSIKNLKDQAKKGNLKSHLKMLAESEGLNIEDYTRLIDRIDVDAFSKTGKLQNGGWLDKYENGGKVPKAQTGNFGGVNTNILDTSGEPVYETINPGDSNYDAKYRETYNAGAFAFAPNPLDEMVMYAGVDYEKYPYYNDLSKQDREYFKDDGPIGRGVRRRAQTTDGLAKDALAIPGQLLQGALETAMAPQAAMVEGIEGLRENDYNFSNALPGSGMQRIPSQLYGFEDKPGWDVGGSLNTAMDLVADPSNLIGVGLYDDLVKFGLKAAPKLNSIAKAFGKYSDDLIDKTKNISKFNTAKTTPVDINAPWWETAGYGKPDIEMNNIFSRILDKLPKKVRETYASRVKGITKASDLPRLDSSEFDILKNIDEVMTLREMGGSRQVLLERALKSNLDDPILESIFYKNKKQLQSELDDLTSINSKPKKVVGTLDSTEEGVEQAIENVNRYGVVQLNPDISGFNLNRPSTSSRPSVDIDTMVRNISDDVDNVATNNVATKKSQINEAVTEIPNRVRQSKPAPKNSTTDVEDLSGQDLANISSYPYVKPGGFTEELVPMVKLGPNTSKRDFANMVKDARARVRMSTKGDIFTGSTDTSYQSYLPQLNEVFSSKMKGVADPIFLGYKPMNPMGNINRAAGNSSRSVTRGINENIAAYLNNQIDTNISKIKLPDDLLRPFFQNSSGKVMLPQYGLRKLKKGGVIKDDMGQWAHPGKITEISGNTMATHGYGDNPLYVVPDVGEPRIVEANTGTQTFPGATKFTEYPMAQSGDNVVKDFMSNYINSPKFKERLTSSNYNDVEGQVTKRSNNIDNTNYIEQNRELSFLETLNKRAYDQPYSTQGSKYDERLNTIIYDDPQALEYGIDKNSIIAHEYGHAALDTIPKVGDVPSSPDERFLLNDYDTNELTSRLRKYKGQTKHDLKATENKSDLDAFRFELFQQGVYDAGKEDITKDLLKKGKDSFIRKRLLKNYKEKDLIWLMNNIASIDNSRSDLSMMAKNGSSLVELNQLTNFTNYNTPQPGGWLDKYN
jgi:hypothetical protein